MISSEFRAKDLDSSTWKDFETLFDKYGGVQAGCWCTYYHRAGGTPGNSLEDHLFFLSINSTGEKVC